MTAMCSRSPEVWGLSPSDGQLGRNCCNQALALIENCRPKVNERHRDVAIRGFVNRVLALTFTLIWCLLLTEHISCAGSSRSHTARNQVRQFHNAETSRFHISGRRAAVPGCLALRLS